MIKPTLGAALADAARALAAAGIAHSRFEARLLMAHALDVDMATVIGYPERCLAEEERQRIDACVRRRAGREPIARIIGRREFWSLPFLVTGDTLVPRPDSETLVEAALAGCFDRAAPWRILDLGTGTGCLLLALLSELPAAWGVGVDLSTAALATAIANARVLGLSQRAAFVAADWGSALRGHFDIVIANPPYVVTGTIPGLPPDVARFEPRLALDGGDDGLSAFRAMLPHVRALTATDGRAILEIGAGQSAAVSALLAAAQMAVIDIRDDLAGVPRAVVARTGRN